MNEHEWAEVEMEKRLQNHYAGRYGESRPSDEIWSGIAPNLGPANAGTQRLGQRERTGERMKEWMPLPGGQQRRSPAAFAPAALVLSIIVVTFLAAWLFLSAPVAEKQQVAATPTASPQVAQLIATIGAADWGIGGVNPWAYEQGVDVQEIKDGEPSAFLRSNVQEPTGFAVLQKVLSVEEYQGKRVRFQGYVRTDEVVGRAGLWMQVNDAQGNLLTKDEMRDRSIVGTSEWRLVEVVLDVPAGASTATAGLQLEESGSAWIGGARVEVVGEDVALTGSHGPYNLGFEQGVSSWEIVSVASSPYEVGVTSTVAFEGNSSAYIKSSLPITTQAGVIGQTFPAVLYSGERVRLSGYIKSQEVEGWAGMWMRVDGRTEESSVRTLAFDNMQTRPIRGTSDWRRWEIVLDVPQENSRVVIGALMVGKGTIWFDDVRIEIVNNDVPVTGWTALNSADNLGFEEDLRGWWASAGVVSADTTTVRTGNVSAGLKSSSGPEGAGADLAQVILGDDYRNRRIRISAYVKTRDVEGAVTLGASLSGVQQPDNVDSEPVSGSSDWVERSVVISVPSEGGTVTFGIALRGEGEAWLDDVRIEVLE